MKSDTKNNKKSISKSKIIISVIGLLIFSYFVYFFYGANFSMVQTETAVLQQVADSIYTNGYVIRNETLIENDKGGIVSYVYQDGGKVAAGGTVAKIYDSEDDVVANKRIEEIDKQIEELNKITLQAQASQTALDSINKQLNGKLNLLLKDVNAGNFYKLSDDKENLTYLINERLLVTGKVSSYEEKISSLKEEQSALKASSKQATAEIISPVAGYFVSYIDGYENQYDYKNAVSISQDKLTTQLKQNKSDVGKNVIGKVISNLNWYIACPVTADQALQISTNSETVNVNMPYATTSPIPVKVAAINQDTKTSDGALVLQCNYISPELSYLRNETVKIDVKTYKGIRVSKKAIHDGVLEKQTEDENGNETTETKKVQGVYVQYGNELIFKQISILYSGDDFVLCDQNPEEGVLFNGKTIELYDSVVTEGDNLSNGKNIK